MSPKALSQAVNSLAEAAPPSAPPSAGTSLLQTDANAARYRDLAAKCFMWSLQIGSTVADPKLRLYHYFPRGKKAGPGSSSLLSDTFTLADLMECLSVSGKGLLRLFQRTDWAELARRANMEAPWEEEGEEEEGEEEGCGEEEEEGVWDGEFHR